MPFRLGCNPIGTANTSSTTVFTNNNRITAFRELEFFVNLKTLGRYFVYGCSNLKELHIPASVATIGNGAFLNTPRLEQVYCYPIQAPSLGVNVFSRQADQSMGYYTRGAGTNGFHVPAVATGYNSGLYGSTLQDTSLCGFTIIYDL